MSTQNIPYQYKKRKSQKNYPKYNNVCSYGIFCEGLKNEFEIDVVNEPSAFEPPKFYCIFLYRWTNHGIKRFVDYLLVKADKPWHNYYLLFDKIVLEIIENID